MPHVRVTDVFKSDESDENEGIVAWHDGSSVDPWVTLSVYPRGWNDTGEGSHLRLNRDEIDSVISALRRAKRKAFPQ